MNASKFLILGLLLIPHAAAQNHSISRYILALGGGYSQSGESQIKGTIGQPFVWASASDDYRIRSGFWVGEGASTPLMVDVWPGDLNNNGLVDTLDILPLADPNNWLQQGIPRDSVDYGWFAHTIQGWDLSAATFADADGSGRVDIEDFFPICLNWGMTHGEVIYAVPPDGEYESGPAREVLKLIYDQVKSSRSGPQYEIRLFLENLLGIATPKNFALQQNYPNPFNPSTQIKYDIPSATNVRIVIYNLLGQEIKVLADRPHEAGSYQLKWNGLDDDGYPVASGIYFYRLDSRDYSSTKKMTIVK